MKMRNIKEKTRQGSSLAGEIKQSTIIYTKTSKVVSNHIKNKVFIPSSILPALSNVRPFLRDKILYFMHLMVDRYISHHKFNGVRLNYEVMKKMYGRSLKEMLVLMKDWGWIYAEEGHYDSVNHLSTKYHLNIDLINEDMGGAMIEQYIQTPSYNKKINAYMRKREQELKELGVNYEYVNSWLPAFTKTIDSTDKELIQQLCNTNKNKVKITPRIKRRIDSCTKLLDRVERDKGFTKLTVDKYGRMHTTICSLKREFMDYVKCNNKPLHKRDYSCFQMVCLGVACLDLEFMPELLEQYIDKTYKADKSLKTIKARKEFFVKNYSSSITNNFLSSTSFFNHKHNLSLQSIFPCMSLRFSKSLPKEKWLAYSNPDHKKWFEMIEKGEIYQYIQSLACPKLQKLKYSTFKKRVLSSIFSDESNWWAKDILDIIKSEFPTIYKWIKRLKTNVDKAEYKQNGKVARLMQIIESGVIYGKVINELRLNHPHIPITTKHDCVITIDENDNVEVVKRIMENGFSEYGIKLHTKME